MDFGKDIGLSGKEEYLAEYEKEITYSHVVEYPYAAAKKAYPVRWLIVVFSVLDKSELLMVEGSASVLLKLTS